MLTDMFICIGISREKKNIKYGSETLITKFAFFKEIKRNSSKGNS